MSLLMLSLGIGVVNGGDNEESKISLVNTTPVTQIINPGSTAIYNLTLTNKQSSADDFEVIFNASQLPEGWNLKFCVFGMCFVHDSPYVFTASKELKPELAEDINISITVPSDAPDGSYQTFITASSLSNPDISSTINLTIIVPLYNVHISSDCTKKTVAPGNSTIYTISVTNTGNVKDIINLSVQCNKSWDVYISTNSTDLEPGYSINVHLTVIAPMNASNNEVCEVLIKAVSTGNISQYMILSTITTVKIQPYYSVSIACFDNKTSISQGETINITITVTNSGNMEDIIKLSKFGEHNNWLSFNVSSVALKSGESTLVNLSIAIPLDAQVGKYEMTIIGTSEQNGSVKDPMNLTIEVLDVIPPTITDICYAPAIPQSEDVITIYATVNDNIEVAYVKLTYYYCTGDVCSNQYLVDMSCENEDVYTVKIGPFGFDSGAKINYKITAIDIYNNEYETSEYSFDVEMHKVEEAQKEWRWIPGFELWYIIIAVFLVIKKLRH